MRGWWCRFYLMKVAWPVTSLLFKDWRHDDKKKIAWALTSLLIRERHHDQKRIIVWVVTSLRFTENCVGGDITSIQKMTSWSWKEICVMRLHNLWIYWNCWMFSKKAISNGWIYSYGIAIGRKTSSGKLLVGGVQKHFRLTGNFVKAAERVSCFCSISEVNEIC